MNPYPKRIYLSATWKGDRRGETLQMAKLIADQGVTVVRDHVSNKNEDSAKAKRTWVQRIASMLQDCSGLVVILPYDDSSPQTTSPYMVPELLAADAQGIPILLFANTGVVVSPLTRNGENQYRFPNADKDTNLVRAREILELRLENQAELDTLLRGVGSFILSNPQNIRGPLPYPNLQDHHATEAAIKDFLDECAERTPYSFVFNILPFSQRDSTHQTIASEVFRATGMACHISLDAITSEASARRNWELMLRHSSIVIAELSSLRDTCLFEAGCAIGLDKPVYVVSKKGQHVLPFGLDDQRFFQYRSAQELAQHVRETCCAGYRREVFNLNDEFRAAHQDKTLPPGVPEWLNRTTGFSLESRLTFSIWVIGLCIALMVQIVVLLLAPASPKPNILAVFSLLSGLLAWTRVGREFWEKHIGRWLSWLPTVGSIVAVVLAVLLAELIIEKKQVSSSQASLGPATNAIQPKVPPVSPTNTTP